MNTPKSISFYLRVSMGSQDFPAQLHALREFCRRQGWPLPSKKNLFAEKASGAKATRRELDRLLQACRDGRFDCIVTYRADRLGRSFEHLVNVHAELSAAKIRVIGVADSVDTSIETPMTRAFRRMLDTHAELTREMIVENTRNGLAAARKRGRVGGRPRTKDRAQIDRAIKLRRQGKTYAEVKRITGISPGYLADIISGRRRKP
jgi:DNA invertase Pin-like site-specific DNA recombinase